MEFSVTCLPSRASLSEQVPKVLPRPMLFQLLFHFGPCLFAKTLNAVVVANCVRGQMRDKPLFCDDSDAVEELVDVRGLVTIFVC